MSKKKEMDPVCGMWIEIEGDQFSSVYKGKTFYFCEQGCKEKFDRNPEQYMKGFEGRKP